MTVRIRPDNPSKWRVGVLIGVHVVILAHIAHWLTQGSTIGALEPSEAMELPKRGVVNLGLLVLAGGALSTALFGRFFCGWGCHIIALQDLSRWLLKKIGITPRPLRSRVLRWVPYAAFAYMFVWPFAHRIWADLPWPPVTASLVTDNLWANMPGWVIGGLTLVVVGFAAVYVLGAKGFCIYACPYGGLMRVAEPLAPLRIRVTDACRQCASCTAACTSNVRVHEQVRDWGMVRDNDCMKCLDCVAACPNDALYLGFGAPALGARAKVEGKPAGRPWNVGWGEELVLAIGFAIAFFALRGLYGAVPFLLALGLSGAVAFSMLTLLRLMRNEDVRFAGLRLKRERKVMASGWLFAAIMTVVTAGLVHSALIRYHEVKGEAAFEKTRALRDSAMDLDWSPSELNGADSDLVNNQVYHLDLVNRWGLLSNPGLHFPRAWGDYLDGSFERALGEIERATAVQPGAPEVHLLRGRVLVAAGQHRQAVFAYAQAVELAPDRPEGFIYLGSLLATLGDMERALEVFRRGTVAVPGNADLMFNLGVAHAMTAQVESAIAAFSLVVENHPDHRQARENLAGMLAEAGRFEEAAVVVREGLSAEPRDAAYLFLLARILLAQGDVESAATEIALALIADPDLNGAKDLQKQIRDLKDRPLE